MKRHPFDVISFLSGALFCTLAAIIVGGDVITLVEAEWLWPTLLIVFGAALLLSPRGLGAAATDQAPAPQAPPPAPDAPSDLAEATAVDADRPVGDAPGA